MPDQPTTTASETWGTEVVTEVRGTAAYRVYAARPGSLSEVLALAERWGERAYLAQGERVLTARGLLNTVQARARDLVARGVAPGDRVVVLGWNSPEWIINFWATVTIGGVAVLANAWWSAAELNEAVERVRPRLVIAEDRLQARLNVDVERAPWATPAGGSDETADTPLPPAPGERDDAVVIFTSGTSGRPKAALISHGALLAGLQMLLHITRRLPHQVGEATGDAALHTGPMFHVGGVQTLLRAAVVGDTLVMPAGRFDAAEALRLVEQWRIRRWSAVPTMLSRVIDHPDARIRDLTSLRSLTVGGSAAHPELLERIRAGLPGVEPRIATGFGLTENGGQGFAASGADTVARPGSTGKALPLVEVTFAKGAPGVDGELLVRSPTQMTRYLGESENPIDAEGWLHTGDLGRMDDDGYLWITGRSKDMIIRGGENIAPAAVERALLRLPEVADVVVFGLPDADLGEEVAAVVVAPDGTEPDELRSRLKGELASFAIPRTWLLQVEPFPENHAGKVERAAVVEQARARLAGA